jgi:hypothetical protein
MLRFHFTDLRQICHGSTQIARAVQPARADSIHSRDPMANSYYRVGDPRFRAPDGQLSYLPLADLPPPRKPQKPKRKRARKPSPRPADAPGQRLFPGFIELSQPPEGDCE